MGMRYAPEMREPVDVDNGTPLPPTLRRKWTDLPSTCRRSDTHPCSIAMADSPTCREDPRVSGLTPAG